MKKDPIISHEVLVSERGTTIMEYIDICLLKRELESQKKPSNHGRFTLPGK